jgi:hypothetical protein
MNEEPIKPIQEALPLLQTAVLTAQTIDTSKNESSRVMGIIAGLFVLTICIMSLLKISVIEPLYSLGVLTTSFYFGTKHGN